MHDPRKGVRISERDIQALTFIGEGYEVAQYQLHAAIFPNVSGVVVSHFVTRAVRHSWIAVERWNRVGINRLRLTSAGREVVVQAGADPKSLFVPKRPVATKDVAHTLWINDVRIALLDGGAQFDVVLAAWQLQRRMSPAPTCIPDVLAIKRGDEEACSFVFGCEVDLGGERLLRTFLPKLRTLQELLREWSAGGESRILVLTGSSRRAAAINDRASAECLSVIALPLPTASGVTGIGRIATIISGALEGDVHSN